MSYTRAIWLCVRKKNRALACVEFCIMPPTLDPELKAVDLHIGLGFRVWHLGLKFLAV